MPDTWQRLPFGLAARALVAIFALVALLLPAVENDEADDPPESPVPALELTVGASRALPGETVGVVIRRGAGPPADVVLVGNDRPLARRPLAAGGRADFAIEVPAPGPLVLGAELRGPDDDALLEASGPAALVDVALPPQVLVVTTRPSPYAESLAAGGWPVTTLPPAASVAIVAALPDTSLLVLDDVPAADLQADVVSAVAQAVRRDALGLLVLGGPGSFGRGAYRGSALEALLPVVSEPPETEPAASVLFLVDVSGSMGRPAAAGTRISIAEQAVLDTARALRPIDRVGLVSFAVEPRLRLPLAGRDDHPEALRAAWPAAASGGTRLLPALVLALDALDGATRGDRLLVLLSDGFVGDDEAAALSTALSATSIDVLGLIVGAADGGQRTAPAGSLADLLAAAGHRAVVIDDILALPRLMRTAVEAERPAIAAGPFAVRIAAPAAWLPGALPAVDRVLVTRPRAGATVHAVTGAGDVVVASRTAGAGRVVVVTSGLAGDAWRWLESPDWPAVAAGLAEFLAARSGTALELETTSEAGGRINVTAEIGETTTPESMSATLVTPDERVEPVRLEPLAAGRLGTTLELAPGLYRLTATGPQGSASARFLVPAPAGPTSRSAEARPAGHRADRDRAGWIVAALAGFVLLLARERW